MLLKYETQNFNTRKNTHLTVSLYVSHTGKLPLITSIPPHNKYTITITSIPPHNKYTITITSIPPHNKYTITITSIPPHSQDGGGRGSVN